jgi:hypothetical protein
MAGGTAHAGDLFIEAAARREIDGGGSFTD